MKKSSYDAFLSSICGCSLQGHAKVTVEQATDIWLWLGGLDVSISLYTDPQDSPPNWSGNGRQIS